MTFTFDWRGREISEEADGHLQNISFLELGVTCVVFANKRQDQALQVIETVIDASASSLLQQGLQSLKGITTILIFAALWSIFNFRVFFVCPPFLTFLSSWACFLWATVERAGRGWPASAEMLGLISFAVALMFVCTFSWRSWAQMFRSAKVPAIYVAPGRQRGGNRSGGWAGSPCLWGNEQSCCLTIWSWWGPAFVYWYAEFRDYVWSSCFSNLRI